MTNEEKVEHWTELSEYDLETADAMLQTKRYLYVGLAIIKTAYTNLLHNIDKPD